MPEVTLIVKNKVGLHARPAALFVQTAKQFQSEIKVKKDEKAANAKSILSVLTLGIDENAQIKVEAVGDDAQKALDAISKLVNDNFGEPV
jgi:phosphocarrier protein HPr